MAKEEPNAIDRGSVPPPARPAPFAGVPASWKPAGEVLDRVTAIPTRLIGFDVATRVGGLPVRRIHTLHGPTHEGKTQLLGALLASFVEQGHVAGYVDAEHATDKTWFEKLFGVERLEDVSNFVADRPRTYEETIKKVDEFLAWVRGLRRAAIKEGKPPPASILGVDSINKLVPKRELEQLSRMGGDAIDKGWGRLRAAFNQAWLDHLTPLLAEAECALVLVAQEREEDEETWDPSRAAKIKGGRALAFDASLLIRVTKAAAVREDPADKESPIVGFRHRIRIYKSKVGEMDGRYSDAFFHVSNGKLTPSGFDPARDVLAVARDLELVKLSGSWLSWQKKRWQGERRAVLAIAADSGLRSELLAAIRASRRP